MKSISLEDVRKAEQTLKGLIQRTQVNHSLSVSRLLNTKAYLKFENEQTTGSFKIRGAMNKIKHLSEEEKARGVVASSAGNHAQGVAYSASQVGCKAHIVMPTTSPMVKVLATQGYGAHVIQHGQIYDEAYAKARELEKENGYTFVHPYEDPMIIAGQGTLGLELMEQIADLDSVILPIGGGGLISGVATVIKTLKPSCRVYGAVAENSPGMQKLFYKKPLDNLSRKPTIADGLAVKSPSSSIYENYLARLVDDVVAVSEDEIAESIVMLLERAKTVVEGSGAVTLAAATKAKWQLGSTCCVVLSGGNIDLNTIAKVIERGLSRKGRITRISVIVPDRPGTLNRLTQVIADSRANILQVNHERQGQMELSETRIDFLLETKSQTHIDEIKSLLEQTGAKLF